MGGGERALLRTGSAVDTLAVDVLPDYFFIMAIITYYGLLLLGRGWLGRTGISHSITRSQMMPLLLPPFLPSLLFSLLDFVPPEAQETGSRPAHALYLGLLHICMYVCMNACIHTYVCIYMYMDMYTHTHTHTHTQTHTHTHTHTHTP